MAQPFTHSAEALHGFFSQMGRGFYIPYYQRNYSWDDENAKKLITDIFAAVRRTLSKPTHALFLGTVILHDEKNPKLGTHFDTPNLLTKVSNVVDGQQRITSLAILACVFAEYAGRLASQLTTVGGAHAEFSSLANELTGVVVLFVHVWTRRPLQALRGDGKWSARMYPARLMGTAFSCPQPR